MSIHHLKINKQPFDDLVSGRKTGEVRDCSDRDFNVGDSVELFMTETATGLATESIVRTITHIQRGYGLPDDICVLSYAAPVVERQPVAEISNKYGDPAAFAERELRPLVDIQKLPLDTMLYASPPAPVALTQDAVDRIVPSLNPEPDREEFHCEWALWADRERIRSKLSQLMTANPVPIVVVLPEYRFIPAEIPLSEFSLSRGWNACLDEFKRLNP